MKKKNFIVNLKSFANLDQSLRDYQLENKCRIYDEWLNSDSIMLQMPTGTGKTRLFASILKDIFMNSMYYGNAK